LILCTTIQATAKAHGWAFLLRMQKNFFPPVTPEPLHGKEGESVFLTLRSFSKKGHNMNTRFTKIVMVISFATGIAGSLVLPGQSAWKNFVVDGPGAGDGYSTVCKDDGPGAGGGYSPVGKDDGPGAGGGYRN
jgi:hypothetical protein